MLAEWLEADGWTHTPEPHEDGSTLSQRGDVRLEVAFLARTDDGQVYTPLREGRAPWADSAARDDASAAAKDRADLAALAHLHDR